MLRSEVWELVGLYLLKKIKNIIPPSHVGLYRDDGLAVITDANGQKIDKIKKKLHRCFKDENLKIVVNVNMVKVDFLDIHLNIAIFKTHNGRGQGVVRIRDKFFLT